MADKLDLKNLKLPVGVIGIIVAQAFGLIWYVAQLDSTVTNLDTQITTIQKSVADTDIAVLQSEVNNLKNIGTNLLTVGDQIDQFDDRLSEIETIQAVIDNEMRTIMADHSGFAEVLSELQKSGLLPTGEKRQYGSYGD